VPGRGALGLAQAAPLKAALAVKRLPLQGAAAVPAAGGPRAGQAAWRCCSSRQRSRASSR
jgi:hypothetical protein